MHLFRILYKSFQICEIPGGSGFHFTSREANPPPYHMAICPLYPRNPIGGEAHFDFEFQICIPSERLRANGIASG